jgi:glycosyltransferase involved in cell wall biosynthesis
VRLAVVASHPIQYHAPLFRALAKELDLTVLYAHRATAADQASAGFGVGFEWDCDLLSGYEHLFLRNRARRPSLDHFAGCDTPEVGARLRERHFDAVLVLGWHLKTYLQAAFAAKRLGLPVLARSDSHLLSPRSIPKKAVKRIIYPWFLRLFDGGLYVGEMSRAYWRHYGYPETRLFLSPHCIDTQWFAARATAAARNVLRSRLGLSEASHVALFAGKLLAAKRPLDLVAAAAQSNAKGCEIAVMVAGAGPLEGEMIAAARAAGVRLHALGFCNQSELPAAYAAADVLVLPSAPNETWGLVANEALACGCPVVLSDKVGGAPELAGDGETGAIFPATDIAALAAAMTKILRERPSRAAVRAKSSAYSPDAAALAILRAALASRKRSANDAP